jgi:prepilin-type N-terminal cleavage/methylation domain-containing protein
MRSYISRDQRGFTLIEMSIVLVIIGLIVGGILKGQEVIESARQKNMASLYDQIRSAQNTFLDRYRALPGDYNEGTTKIHSSVGDGDRNGYVGTDATNASAIAGIDGSTGENYNYFNQLIAAGLFGGGQITSSTGQTNFSGGATASPLPSAPWSASGFSVASGTHEGGTIPSSLHTVWLRLAKDPAAIAATDAALTAQSAFQIDQKFDDGVPSSGRIRNSGNKTVPCGGPASVPYTVAQGDNTRQCDLFLSTD